MADRPARTRPALHIAACLKIVAKHRKVPSVTVDEARDAIKRIAHYGDTDPRGQGRRPAQRAPPTIHRDVDRRARVAHRSLAQGRNL